MVVNLDTLCYSPCNTAVEVYETNRASTRPIDHCKIINLESELDEHILKQKKVGLPSTFATDIHRLQAPTSPLTNM
jgi:hypothetical protein